MNAPRTRVQRRPVHGVLLLDKPLGLSSNDALQKAKWLLRAEKAGHTGTLDPMATGVLPLCFGAATKFSQLHLDADKSYQAVIQLGVRTASGDAEGEVLSREPVPVIAPERLAEVQRQFTGALAQVPPMHSALKRDGKALYEYARAGETVEREARNITVHELQLSLQAPDRIVLACRVSKGTYIRALGEDIAAALGCGGHLTFLRRTATGSFGLAQCVTLEELETLGETERLARLDPVAALLPGHTRIELPEQEAGRFLSGMRRRGSWRDDALVAVHGPGGVLLGTGHVKAGELIPSRLLSPIEIQQILGSEEPLTT